MSVFSIWEITVVHRNGDLQSDACDPAAGPSEYVAEPWNKSIIVKDLREEHDLSVGMARAVATAVEEEVMSLARRTPDSGLRGGGFACCSGAVLPQPGGWRPLSGLRLLQGGMAGHEQGDEVQL